MTDVNGFLRRLEARRRLVDGEAQTIAAAIIEEVRANGDAACAQQVARFDGVTIAPEELLIEPRGASIDPALADALDVAIARITRYHEPQRPRGYEVVDDDGSVLRSEIVPLRRVGIYVPGGAATYISTLLMCAIPARIAGVRELVVITTPRAAASAELQYVAKLLGVREIYRCGGAAGIAAAAQGTASLRRVDKIVGPGNRWVAAAKQLVASSVGVDLIAGPSEIVVLADDTADPELVAADMRAQAEHGEDSTPVCVTTSAAFAETLRGTLNDRGEIIVATDLDEAIAIVDAIAPEHLELQLANPAAVLPRIENCVAIFVGGASGVAFGDYIAGSNHVLPTAGSARFSSPLGVADFVKRRSVVQLSDAGAAKLARSAETIAIAEGLPMHAASCAVRRTNQLARSER